jgi:hypothetical protein
MRPIRDAPHFKEFDMSTLKDALCLLAIFVVYGVVGQMDYEDAVAAQEVQQASLPTCHPVCLSDLPAVDPEGSAPSRWPNNSLTWQTSCDDRCPPDSGGERAPR